jgi:hypothetical protein
MIGVLMSGRTQPRDIAHQLTFIDLRLTSIESILGFLGYRPPLTLNYDPIRTTLFRPNGIAVYEVTYGITATDLMDRSVWRFTCAFALIFQVEGDVTDREFEEYTSEVWRIAHPNFSELVTATARDAGLPTLVLETYRPPTNQSATGS